MAERYRPLDLFRGLTVACMILVNDPGTWARVYPPLRHAEWDGCTPTDLVFPFFLFAVGMSMWFSFAKNDHRLTSGLAKKIAKRAAIIFGIGLALNAFPFIGKSISEWRIMGVLQRIALAFALASFMSLGLSRRALIWASAGLLLSYWALLWAWNPTAPFELGSNLAGEFDRWIFGDAHLYKGYRNAAGERMPFDPEGLLSTLPAAVTVVIGYLTGELIQKTSAQPEVAARNLMALGLSLAAVGAFWGLFFPINKPIWSSSYVLFTGGLAILLMGLFVWLFGSNRSAAGTGPIVHFGLNPLFAYVFSAILAKTLFTVQLSVGSDGNARTAWTAVYEAIFAPIDGGGELSSLLFALAFVAVCWAPCYWLYRKNVIIKI